MSALQGLTNKNFVVLSGRKSHHDNFFDLMIIIAEIMFANLLVSCTLVVLDDLGFVLFLQLTSLTEKSWTTFFTSLR